MNITIYQTMLPHDDPDASLAFYRDTLGFEVRNDVGYKGMHWITVGPAGQPGTSIVLYPPAATPGLTDDEHRLIAEMMAKGTYASINLATKDLDGTYESGSRPASEPETRAVMRFLEEVDPRRVLSFHQPLHGIDTDTKEPGFARRLARTLRLPRTRLDCGGLCHGTMTMWFNHRFAGSALTIELWARAETFANCAYRDCRLISKAAGTDEAAHYWMVSPIQVGGVTRLRFRLKTAGGGTQTLIAGSGALAAGTWVHVAAVYDGARMQLYQDGVLVARCLRQAMILRKPA